MEKLTDRWHARDYPVLLEAARLLDSSRPADPDTIAETAGLARDEVDRALDALVEGAYLRRERSEMLDRAGNATHYFGTYLVLAERGRRTVGLWPDEQAIADRLLWILEQKVNEATSPEERSRWKAIRDSIGSAGRDIAVELAAALAVRTAGM